MCGCADRHHGHVRIHTLRETDTSTLHNNSTQLALFLFYSNPTTIEPAEVYKSAYVLVDFNSHLPLHPPLNRNITKKISTDLPKPDSSYWVVNICYRTYHILSVMNH